MGFLDKKRKDKVEEPEQELKEDINSGVGGEEESEIEQHKSKDKEKKVEEIYVVVKELPVQQIRFSIDEKTGVKTNFITIEEALSDIMNA